MNKSLKSFALFLCLVLILSASIGFAQNDARRTTIAVTYPLDQTIDVPFHALRVYRGSRDLPR